MLGTYLGNIGVGTNKGIVNLYSTNVWNKLDDIALYKSILRRENEDNITFRNRIIKGGPYNSSINGLLNYLNDCLDNDRTSNTEKKTFISTYTPLSYNSYMKLTDTSEEYITPQVIADDITYSFLVEPQYVNEFITHYFDGKETESSSDKIKGIVTFNKTVIYNGDIYWTLYKNIDQTYSKIFECNIAPQRSVILKYQTIIDDEIVMIEESCSQYVRNDKGEIIKETYENY